MKTFDIEKMIPRFLLNDTNCKALAMAIQAAVRTMNTTVSNAKRYLYDVDAMRSERLDDMLWELNIDPAVSISDDEKRGLIRNAFDFNKRAGTAYGLCGYIDTFSKYTYVGNAPDDDRDKTAGVVILTDEGLTASVMNDIATNYGRYKPIIEPVSTLQGQTIGYGCKAWVEISGRKLTEKAIVLKDMKDYVNDNLALKYGSSKVKLTVNGTQKTLTKSSHESYEDDLLYEYTTTDQGSKFTKVVITDRNDTLITERDMKATEIKDQYYFLKVYAHYNDDAAPVCSLDLAGQSAEWVMTSFNESSRMTNMKALVKFEDNTERVVTGCTTSNYVKHGWYVTRYVFTFSAAFADKRITSVKMGYGSSFLKSYLLGIPDSITNSIYPGGETSIAFCFAVKSEGHPPSELDEFILDISSVD